MRHALLSRFQGTLLAAALGDKLGRYSRSQQAVPHGTSTTKQTINLAGWHPHDDLASALDGQPSYAGGMAVSCMRTLVEAGGWHEPQLLAIGELATSRTDGVAAKPLRADRSLPETIAAELAIATLPISLFFHENESKQQQHLLQTVKLWHCPSGAEAVLLAVGYAIAQLLQDHLEPRTLLPQTITYLKQSTANPTTRLLELIGALEQAQRLVQQSTGLHTAIERLWAKNSYTGSGAIALAFYCFLSTPADLRLSLLRAARCGEAAPDVCSLTGALSGAYHGINGLPLAWQLGHTSLWGITDTALRQLTAHLFATWSGVYAPPMPLDAVAIAAPGVIRPR